MSDVIVPSNAKLLPRTLLSSFFNRLAMELWSTAPDEVEPDEDEDRYVVHLPAIIDPLTMGPGSWARTRINKLDNSELNKLLVEASKTE